MIPATKHARCFLIALCLLGVAVTDSLSEPFPSDAGIIDVRSYGARGDGVTDDTAALLAAIQDSGTDTGRAFWHDRIVYLPAGTYLVSDTLLKRYKNGLFGSGLILIGESRTTTTIKLADNAQGFDDPDNPRAVIYTTSKLLASSPTEGGRNYLERGEGNDAFMNAVEDLTIDVGHGNPGAIAIDFLGNNLAAVRNVTLRAPSDSGAVGLSAARRWPGPSLIQNLDIIGFDVGIRTAQTEYGLTFDRIHLVGQKRIAIHNHQNALTMRGVNVGGQALALVNEGEKAFLAIDDALFPAPDGTDPTRAMLNEGIVRLRDVRLTTPRASDLESSQAFNGVLYGPDDWRREDVPAWLPPTDDSPTPPQIPPDRWANVTAFGAIGTPDHDSTAGLRRAFESGAAVIYLPHGTYAVSDTIEIPPTVQRIVGMHSTIEIFSGPGRYFPNDKPFFHVGTEGLPMFIDRLTFDHTGRGQRTAIQHSGPRSLALRDIIGAGVTLVDREVSGGAAYIDNTCCGKFAFAGAQPVYARQLNTEGGSVRIQNSGSPLWVLGLKTEGICTVLENRNGARSEIFGGLVYVVRDGAGPDVPVISTQDSWVSAIIAEESLRRTSRYSVFLTHRSSAGTRTIEANELPERGLGRAVPGLLASPESVGQ